VCYIPDKRKKKERDNQETERHELYLKLILDDSDISQYNLSKADLKKKIKNYEKETGKYAVWLDRITEGFKKWLKGEKIYERDKERISLYITEEQKNQWLEFVKNYNYSSISKLIRESVDFFIKEKGQNNKLSRIKEETLIDISHALKVPLTSIKGFSQLLLEDYRDELNDDIISTLKSIFEQSVLLENKIVNILDNIKEVHPKIDILLIEDDLATIRLLKRFFDKKGYKCKGVISGTKGLEELRHSKPKLILLDVILPDLSGYEICNIVKSNEQYKNIPIFYLTAIPDSEIKKKVSETKADGYILKPFDFSNFEIIFRYLKE